MLSIVMAVAILICGVNGVWEEKIKAKTSLNINESKLVSGFTKKTIKKEDKEENYIVVAKSHKIINQLKKNYEAVERSHNEDLLAANENMITLSLTGCEANALQDQKGMLLVEIGRAHV